MNLKPLPLALKMTTETSNGDNEDFYFFKSTVLGLERGPQPSRPNFTHSYSCKILFEIHAFTQLFLRQNRFFGKSVKFSEKIGETFEKSGEHYLDEIGEKQNLFAQNLSIHALTQFFFQLSCIHATKSPFTNSRKALGSNSMMLDGNDDDNDNGDNNTTTISTDEPVISIIPSSDGS